MFSKYLKLLLQPTSVGLLLSQPGVSTPGDFVQINDRSMTTRRGEASGYGIPVRIASESGCFALIISSQPVCPLPNLPQFRI